MSLKLGVPSKGRLMEKTFGWFGARGVTLTRAGSEREYAGRVDGIAGVELALNVITSGVEPFVPPLHVPIVVPPYITVEPLTPICPPHLRGRAGLRRAGRRGTLRT